MNEDELVEKRLSVIESKIDKLTDIVSQTQLQEFRIKQLEDVVKENTRKLTALEKQAGNTALKWLGIIGSGIITLLLGFIAVKLGMK